MKIYGLDGGCGKRIKQRGFSTLLLTLLTGVSIAGVSMGLVYSINSTQSSVVANHAQTQAQIRAMTGFQVLAEVFKGRSYETLNEIQAGAISSSNSASSYQKSVAGCPPDNPPLLKNTCFDISARSEQAVAVLQTVFASKETVGGTPGSVFAGGLVVNDTRNLTGDSDVPVIIETGGESAGEIVDVNGDPWAANSFTGIQSTKYRAVDFPTPEGMRKYSNYIYYRENNSIVCRKNNLPGIVVETPCSQLERSYVSWETTGGDPRWFFSAVGDIPAGVFWFDGPVEVRLSALKPLVNTIVATGDLKPTLPSSVGTDPYSAYAPKFYQREFPGSVAPDKVIRYCGTETTRPIQYCTSAFVIPDFYNDDGTLADLSEFTDKRSVSVANILFLTKGNITLDASNRATTNYFGNIVATYGSGGTGSPSGYFTGSGTINITGNIVVAGTANATQMTGNIRIDMSNVDPGDAAMPMYESVVGSIRYR